MFGYNSLENYYFQMYYLMFDLHQSLETWENLVPFERDIYLQIFKVKMDEKQKEMQSIA